MRDRYRVDCPHLIVWGTDDTALLPEARDGIEHFADDVTIREIEGASHWLLHEQPSAVASLIDRWLAANRVERAEQV